MLFTTASRILPAVLFVLFSIHADAQHLNVMISDDDNPEEPSIMINPKNPDQIVAGSNINHCYISEDGGITWDHTALTSSYGVWGDPCIITDTTGAFYFFHLSYPPAGQGSWIDRIVCQRLDDISGTWTNGSYMGLNGTKAQDKEWVDVDRNTNTLYCTWTQFDEYGSSSPADSSMILFSKSTDRGETWSAAKRLNKVAGDCIDSDNTTEGAVPAVGPNGEVYVSWAGPAGLVFDRSLDGGNTWLDEDIFVSDIPGGWDYAIPGIMRANGLPVTVCDLSNGPNRGTIYINWSDQRNGTDDTDVWLVKSTDGGNTWTSAKRVNDDPPGRQQFFTWMTVDNVTGYLYFVFYDRRNHSNFNTDVYMAVSKDGGETFTNFKVSNSPFLPNAGVFFGDYTNISAYNNIVRPIWTRLHNGQLSVWTAIVDPNAVGIEENAATPFAIADSYPNPFRESSLISFKLRQPGTVTLDVYNALGKKVATLIDKELLQPGKYIRKLDAEALSLKPGIYYFSLQGSGIKLSKQIVLVD